MSDADPEQMRLSGAGEFDGGPLGDVYRLLSRPRMHYGGAEAACQQFCIVLELQLSRGTETCAPPLKLSTMAAACSPPNYVLLSPPPKRDRISSTGNEPQRHPGVFGEA